MDMIRYLRRSALERVSNERGFALAYMAVILTGLCLFTGLAVDSGRGYVVKAQLTKAVDGAALAAARALNSGDPRAEAVRVFKANFPPGYMGTMTSPDPTAAGNFFALTTDMANAVNVVTVQAQAVLPTTFMRLGNFTELRVNSLGEARRRMVDLSLVVDVSSSIGWRWPYVRDAARAFVNSFAASHDRVSLIFFHNGGQVIDQMTPARGFNKSAVMSHIPNGLPGGSTAMVQGLFRGWDELRTVSNGQQSSLRVIVLFTDGCSNSVPGIYPELAAGVSRGLRTYDFPDNGADPDGQTHANPRIEGLFDTATGAAAPGVGNTPTTGCGCNPGGAWCCGYVLPTLPWMPTQGYIQNPRSGGMQTTFPLMTAALTVNGVAQNVRRPMTGTPGPSGRFPAKITNVNNAARNLVEIVANAARSDATGDYPIRIYAIGMGEIVGYNLGSIQEPGHDVLKRVANDATSLDFKSSQLEGKYYYAQTEADVGPAFQALQAQIIRLSK
jgi:Flp pilus assembly protein TadG